MEFAGLAACVEGLLLLKDSDEWSELLQSVMTAFESYVKSYPIFGARLLFYNYQATGDRDLLKKGWKARKRKTRAGREERKTKTTTGARSEATKRYECCAFSARRFAPLHYEFHGDSLRSSLTPTPSLVTGCQTLSDDSG